MSLCDLFDCEIEIELIAQCHQVSMRRDGGGVLIGGEGPGDGGVIACLLLYSYSWNVFNERESHLLEEEKMENSKYDLHAKYSRHLTIIHCAHLIA